MLARFKFVEARLVIHTYHLMVMIVGLYRFFVWFTKGSACPQAHRMELIGVEFALLFLLRLNHSFSKRNCYTHKEGCLVRKRSFLQFLTILLFGASALAGCTLPASSSSASSSSSSSTSSSSIQSSTSLESSSSVSSASSDSSSSSVDSSTSSSTSSSSSSSSSSATQPLEVAFELDLDDAKVTFAYGEAFAATGLAVYGVYDDDSRVLVETNQYAVAAPTYQATVPGTYPVNITYKTYPVQHYDVTVAAKVEDGFIINHSAVDKTLDYGQALDLSPLVVHATYVVGDDEVLSTGYTIDQGGFSATTPGTYTITVSYQTYTAQTFQVTVADKIKNGFELDTSLVVTDLTYGQLLNTNPLKVYATYVVGERELLPTSAYQIRLGSYAYNNPGVHDIIVAYSTYPDQTFQVTVGEPEEVRFGIDDSAVDHMLDYGQELDLTPLNVFTFNQIDEPTPLLSGYTIDQGGFSATTPGTYTITVSYQTYDTQSFQVTVNEPVEDGFTIDASMAPQTFAYGEPFDATGLLVYATYEVGEDTLLSPGDFMIDIGGYDKFVPGSYTITITYGSYPDQTYTVTVLEAEPVSIEMDHTLVETNLVKGS
ncbi:MAG: bacterial Ig-like domain-containing protein, partial [Bacilli bacterium]